MFTIREAVSNVKGKQVSYKVFFSSKAGAEEISLSGKIISDNNTKNIIQYMALYANYEGADIPKLNITSTGCSREEQAK